MAIQLREVLFHMRIVWSSEAESCGAEGKRNGVSEGVRDLGRYLRSRAFRGGSQRCGRSRGGREG
jgi:hypothetical protein